MPVWLPAFLSTITYVVDVQMVHARPFSKPSLWSLSNGIKNTSRRGVLTPTIELWSFGSPRGLQVPTFGSASLILTFAPKWGCDRYSMRRFCNKFLQNLETCTLCYMCTTFPKSWNWFMHTMRPVLWGLHHVQCLSLHQLRQLDHHILFQRLKWCTRLHPSYLFITIVAILPTKLVNATFFPRISFVIIVGKRDIRKFFVLPSSWNKSNSD